MSAFLNKSQILDRGWTASAITKFLGEPDRVARNKRNRKAKIQLFDYDRVLSEENTAAWKKWKQGSLKRSAAAKQAAATRRRDTIAKATSRLHTIVLDPEYTGLSKKALKRAAVEHFEQRELVREYRSGGNYVAETITPRRGDPFIERITVNFLRHSGTIYDKELDTYFSSIGVNQAKDIVREHVYGLIKTEYPYLASECDRQLGLRRAQSASILKQDVTARTAFLD